MKDNLQLRDSSGFAPDSLLITSQVNQSCNRLQRYNKKRIPQKITCFLFGITYYLPHIFNNSPPLHGWGWGGVSVFYPYIILFIFFSLISPTPPLSPPLHGWGIAWKQTLSCMGVEPTAAGRRGKAIARNGIYRNTVPMLG